MMLTSRARWQRPSTQLSSIDTWLRWFGAVLALPLAINKKVNCEEKLSDITWWRRCCLHIEWRKFCMETKRIEQVKKFLSFRILFRPKLVFVSNSTWISRLVKRWNELWKSSKCRELWMFAVCRFPARANCLRSRSRKRRRWTIERKSFSLKFNAK